MSRTTSNAGAETPGGRASRGQVWGKKAGLVGVGLLAGGILAGTVSATAASSPTPAPTPAPASAGSTPGDTMSGEAHRGFKHRLSLAGTVQSVGASTVTITTSSGATTYAVTADSDIDKNGEAKLSNLVVGDAVRFSTVTTDGKPTIDKLHAGNETKNRPQGQYRYGDRDGAPSPAPSGATNG